MVAQEMKGTITSSPGLRGFFFLKNREANPTRFAEDPELVMTEYFTPNFLAYALSNCLTCSPMVKRSASMTRRIASISSSPQLDSAKL